MDTYEQLVEKDGERIVGREECSGIPWYHPCVPLNTCRQPDFAGLLPTTITSFLGLPLQFCNVSSCVLKFSIFYSTTTR